MGDLAGRDVTIYMVYNMIIMITVNIADAKSRLAEYLRRVEAGETVTSRGATSRSPSSGG